MNIGDKLIKPVESDLYVQYAKWCNKNYATIVDCGDYYEVVSVGYDAERVALEQEMMEKQLWLTAHDYIGTKIATGRATVADYATEIQTMREYADRIDEIREILRG